MHNLLWSYILLPLSEQPLAKEWRKTLRKFFLFLVLSSCTDSLACVSHSSESTLLHVNLFSPFGDHWGNMFRLCILVEDRAKARVTEYGERRTLKLCQLDPICALSVQHRTSTRLSLSFSFLIHTGGKPVLISLISLSISKLKIQVIVGGASSMVPGI